LTGLNKGGAVVIMGGGYGILRRVYASQHHNGVIASSGDLTIEDSDFVDNAPDTISPPAALGAAVVTVNRSNTAIYRSRFINNRSNVVGGAIAVAGDFGTVPTYLTVASSTFRGNSTSTAAESGGTYSNGGAIGVYGPNNTFAYIYDSVFINNHAVGDYAGGGAIYDTGNVKIYRSVFEGNIADFGGGAISSWSNTLIRDSSFTLNKALLGGALYASANTGVFNSTFDGNISGAAYNPDGTQYATGAAMYINGPTTKIKNVTMTNNYDVTNPDPVARTLVVGPAGDIAISYSTISNDNGIPACAVVTGFTSYDYNVVNDNSCPFANASAVAIGLGPLQPIGYTVGAPGETRTTLHRIPEPSSALLNTGESFVNATDDPSQLGCTRADARGINRPISGLCDIGAIEAQ
jgi:hypothetical protein